MGIRAWFAALFGSIPPEGSGTDPVPGDPIERLLSENLRPDWRSLPQETRAAIANDLTEGLLGPSSYGDPDQNLTAAQGGSWAFRRLTASRRDLQPLQQQRMLEIAWYLYDSNPQAKRILELPRDYILGDGVSLTANDADEPLKDRLQASVDAFWYDPFNRLDQRMFDRVLELGMFGEVCLSVTVNPKDGMVRLGYVDPAAIKTVIVNPTNEEDQIAVSLVGQAGGGLGMVDAGDERRLKIVRVDLDPMSPTYGRRVGAVTDPSGKVVEQWQDVDSGGKVLASGTYGGSCMLFQINKVSNARRGRSDLLCLADWVDGYDQVLFSGVDRALLIKSFIWDVVMEGASKEQIDAYLAANQAPRPGSVRGHNEKITWNAVSPDLKVADDAAIADLIQSNMATGAGLSKIWLNGAMDVNRASSGSLSEPAIAHLGARQRYVRYLIQELVYTALDHFELAGKLPRRPDQEESTLPVPWDVTVNMPELRPRDMQAASQTFQFVATATSTALADDLIDEEVAQDIIAHAAAQVGVEYDVQQMRDRLVVQKQERQERQAAQMALQPRTTNLVGPNDAQATPGNGKVPAEEPV